MQPQVIRIAISKATFSGFPAENEGFIEALCNWDEEGQPENPFFDNTFSLTDSHLCKLVCENGAKRAMAYMSMITAIFTALFGIQEGQACQEDCTSFIMFTWNFRTSMSSLYGNGVSGSRQPPWALPCLD
jgi:hypothetical protein